MFKLFYQERGAVAVYLSVIFLSMMILAAVITDAACIHTAQIHAARAADIAARSILSEYDQNLKDAYGLFAFNGSKEEIGQKVHAYTNRMLNPDFSVLKDDEYVDFYDFKVESIQIETEDLSLNNLDIFEEQILDYMKYRAVLGALFDFSKEVEGIRKAGNGLELMNKAKVVYEETKKLEDEINQLRKYSDGWRYEKNGFQPYQNSIKSLCISKGRDGQKKYLSNLSSWLSHSDKEKLKNNLINISALNEMNDAYMDDYDEYAYLYCVIEGLKGVKRSLNLEDEDDDKIHTKIELMLKKYQKKLKKCDIQGELLFYKDRENACNRAIKSIDSIHLAGQHISELIDEIEVYIEDMGDEITIELKDSIKDDITNIKDAIGQGFGSNLQDAKQKIINNRNLIEGINDNLIQDRTLRDLKEKGYELGRSLGSEFDKDDFLDEMDDIVENNNIYNSAKRNYDFACTQLMNQYDSDFLVEICSFKNLMPVVQERVLDMGDIEEAEDEEPTYHSLDENRVLKNEYIISELPTCIYGIDSESLIDIGSLTNISMDVLSLENIKNKLYLNEYIISNFNHHTIQDRSGETFYKHEVEYILYGRYDEGDNFSNFQRDVFFLRTAMNLMHIYTDNIKRQQTLEAATTLTAGFGGAGVFIVQFLIASAWAGAEAKLDLDQIVAGEDTPFIKNRDNWTLSFEHFVSGKRKKQEKIVIDDKKQTNNTGKIDKLNRLNYEDYLRLFLLFRSKENVLYRTLDLIQINMKGRHYEDFETRFYYGACKINMDASAKHIFLKFNWMPDSIKNATLGRKKFKIEVEHFY